MKHQPRSAVWCITSTMFCQPACILKHAGVEYASLADADADTHRHRHTDRHTHTHTTHTRGVMRLKDYSHHNYLIIYADPFHPRCVRLVDLNTNIRILEFLEE